MEFEGRGCGGGAEGGEGAFAFAAGDGGEGCGVEAGADVAIWDGGSAGGLRIGEEWQGAFYVSM